MTGLKKIFSPEVRKQLFLVELTGLLHNVGKLSSSFITKYAYDPPGGFDYDLERVVDPARVITIKTASAAIIRPLNLAWITDLCDEPIWKTLQPAADEVKRHLTGSPSSLGGVQKRIRVARDAAIAAGTVAAPDIAEVANKLASAAALSNL